MSSKNARSLTKDHLQKELEHKKDQEAAAAKQWIMRLKKVYKATKPHRSKHQMMVNNIRKRWKVIYKELVNKTVYIID